MISVLSSHWSERSDLFLWDFFYNLHIFDRNLDSLIHLTLDSLSRDSSWLAYQLIGYVVDL